MSTSFPPLPTFLDGGVPAARVQGTDLSIAAMDAGPQRSQDAEVADLLKALRGHMDLRAWEAADDVIDRATPDQLDCMMSPRSQEENPPYRPLDGDEWAVLRDGLSGPSLDRFEQAVDRQARREFGALWPALDQWIQEWTGEAVHHCPMPPSGRAGMED